MTYRFFIFFLFFVCILTNSGVKAQQFNDPLLLEANIREDTSSVLSLINLCVDFSNKDPQKAIVFCSKALELSEEIAYNHGEALSHKEKAIVYYYMAEYDTAMYHLDLALILFSKQSNIDQTADVLVLQGIIYDMWSLYSLSIRKYFSAINLYEKNENIQGLSVAYSNIALVFQRQKRFDKALEYHTKSLEINRSQGNNYYISVSLVNLGLLYYETNDYEKAILYYEEALEMAIEGKDLHNESVLYNNLGLVYQKQKKYAKALQFFNESLRIKKEIGNRSGIAITYNNIGKIYADTKDFEKAKSSFVQALNIGVEIKSLTIQRDSYENLYVLLKDYGYYKEALSYLENLRQVQDAIMEETYSKQLNELQVRYQAAENEKTIQELNLDNQKQRHRNERQSLLLILVGLISFFTLLLSFIIYWGYRQKKARNILLQEQNRRIELQKQAIEEKNAILAEQSEKLKEIDEIKSRFFTHISHEFRTPLTLISAPVNSILEKNKYPEIEENLRIIEKNAHRLLTLINQLLDLAKIEQQNIGLDLIQSDIILFIRNLFYSFSSYAKEKQIHLVFQGGTEMHVPFDKDKIEKIIVNLVSNAIKFTQENGTVSIDVAHNHDNIQIHVADTGIGIPPEHIERVFDLFYMAEHTSTSDYKGTGVGLALVKELVELHQGSIQVESLANNGTVFTITLPTTYPQYEERIKKQELTDAIFDYQMVKPEKTKTRTTLPSDKTKKNILIVEDNPDMQSFLQKELHEQYNVFQAFNGKDGFEMAIDEDFQLIISDVMMPIMDGFEMVQQIKSNIDTSHIPIILLTSKASDDSIVEGLQTRADDYVTKPFNIKLLCARIESLIANREALAKKFSNNMGNIQAVVTNSLDEKLLTQAVRVVEENIMDSEFTAEKFAEQMNMSRAGLHRKLKALTNQSATEFVRVVKLKKAADFLKAYAGNISEAAYACGFNTPSYFTRCFKEYYGISPSEYMESFKKT
jgi:signal transduction histidine kinase/DNA-binding response OmpR family regulator